MDERVRKYYRGIGADVPRDDGVRKLIESAVRGENSPPRFLDRLTEQERKSYSIARALTFLASEENEHVGGGIEQAVSREISAVTRKKPAPRGMFIPLQLNTRSGLDTKSGTAGAYSVETDIGDLITFLRNRSKVIQLGATVLSGLDSNVAFPVQATATTASWVSQNPGSDVSDSDSSFSQRTLSPKTLQATTSYSRQLLAQSSIAIEEWLRKDLAAAHAVALDAAAVNGSGISNQPTGLLQTSGVGSVVGGTNGAMITYGFMIDLQDKVFQASGDISHDKLGYVASVDVRTKLSKVGVLDQSGAGVTVWSGDMAAGWPAQASKNVPNNLTKGSSSVANAVVFGYWPSLIIGEWGVFEVVVDPYKFKKQNVIEVTSFLMTDILVAQPASFAVMKDALVA